VSAAGYGSRTMEAQSKGPRLNLELSGLIVRWRFLSMEAFLKRVILIALVSAVPTFVSVASAGSGGHSSGGSSGSGGSSSGGHGGSGGSSSGGHSSSAASSGHSSSGSISGHSSIGSNSGHSLSAAKGGHSSDPSTGPGASVVGGHSVSTSSSHSHVRGKPEPFTHVSHFSTGYGHGDWQAEEETVDWRRYHPQLLFGFIWR
jgi:hypothetical protein